MLNLGQIYMYSYCRAKPQTYVRLKIGVLLV